MTERCQGREGTAPPVVGHYQKALDEFRHAGGDPALLKRMSELISLLDLSTLSGSLSGGRILEAALLVAMGELQSAGGALFVRSDEGVFERKVSRGRPDQGPQRLPSGLFDDNRVVFRGSGRLDPALERSDLALLCPVLKGGRAMAVLGIGPRLDGREYQDHDAAFLQNVAACAAAPIESGLVHQELERVNQRLSLKVFQLGNLFDISRELTTSFDEEAIKHLVVSTLMGHLMVSRCALFLSGPEGLMLAHERGVRPRGAASVIADEDARPVLACLSGPMRVADLPKGALGERLRQAGLAVVAPLYLGSQVRGLVGLGERASGAPLGEEDHDFILTLGRQALTALEGVRLHQVQVEKQRQDRELQIAREIQSSLFPARCPEMPGCEVAAESHPCYQVGGDYYDFIPLPQGALALAVADVAGKSTPASILMASVHAWLRGLAGSAPAEALMGRLNTFLHESTQANKYVTMIYAELDSTGRRLRYVNAGHVPPFLLRVDGSIERLEAGGTALGLIEDASYAVGEALLGPGDTVAVVTDGVTEAPSPEGVEFGEQRTVEALRLAMLGSAASAIRGLVSAVRAWAGPAGAADDLTALVVKAR